MFLVTARFTKKMKTVNQQLISHSSFECYYSLITKEGLVYLKNAEIRIEVASIASCLSLFLL